VFLVQESEFTRSNKRAQLPFDSKKALTGRTISQLGVVEAAIILHVVVIVFGNVFLSKMSVKLQGRGERTGLEF